MKRERQGYKNSKISFVIMLIKDIIEILFVKQFMIIKVVINP